MARRQGLVIAVLCGCSLRAWAAVPSEPELAGELAATAGLNVFGGGAEVSLLDYAKPPAPQTWGHGYGVCWGATRLTGYLEAEALLSATPRSERAPDLWALSVFLTAGAGPVVRLTDRVMGVQGTLSATVLVLPLIVFLRPRMFFDGRGAELTAGLMLKVPVWWHVH
jgi:hypothetical protein